MCPNIKQEVVLFSRQEVPCPPRWRPQEVRHFSRQEVGLFSTQEVPCPPIPPAVSAPSALEFRSLLVIRPRDVRPRDPRPAHADLPTFLPGGARCSWSLASRASALRTLLAFMTRSTAGGTNAPRPHSFLPGGRTPTINHQSSITKSIISYQ